MFLTPEKGIVPKNQSIEGFKYISSDLSSQTFVQKYFQQNPFFQYITEKLELMIKENCKIVYLGNINVY